MSRLTVDLIAEIVGPDNTLKVVASALVNVFLRNSDGTQGSSATVYTAASGNPSMSQPLLTDAQGRIPGWLDPGDYLLLVTTGNQTYTQAYSVPVAGAASDVVPSAIVTGTQALAGGVLSRFNISAANGIANLPTAPVSGTRCGVKVVQVNATPGTFTLTLNATGADTFSGGGTSAVMEALGEAHILAYRAADSTWTTQSTDTPFVALGAPRTGNDNTIGTTGGTALGSLVVGTTNIATNAVTSGKLASAAVTSGKVAAAAVDSTNLASGAAATNVGTLTGDVTGTLPTPTVARVNGTTIFNGAGSPAGVVSASRIGDLYIDTTNGRAYQASATGNANWSRITIARYAAATAGSSAAFAADTYLAGSGIVIPVAGAWLAGTIYRCVFDMVKTAAGTATPVVTLRMGTAGTVADAAICTFTFGAGTAVADTGFFEINAEFRSVGSGTSAVVAGVADLKHQLASTGLTSTGTAGYQAVPVASAGFNSTTSTTIGLSFNGGASFSGTNVMVNATLMNTVA